MELIVYIGIASMVLVIALSTSINLFLSDANIQTKQEVYSNARIVTHEFQLQILKADDVILGSSVFLTSPGTLTLDFPGIGTDVIFDTYTKNVMVVGQSVTIRKLRVKEGSGNYVDLTTDQVTVTNLVFSNRTRSGENKNIKIQLTLEKVNPDGNPTYDASISLETAFSLR